MDKILPYLFILFLSSSAFGQSPRIFTSAGSGLNDEPADVIRHSTGNIVTTGYYNQLANFGGIILGFSGSDDAFISCQSPSGAYLWAKQIAGPLTDRGVILREGADGSIYLAGYFRGTAQYDNLSITSNSLSQDVFVAKINPLTGSPIWFRAYGGSAIENLSGMAINLANQILISGQFIGNSQFGSSSLNSVNFYNSGQLGYDIYLTQLNNNGDVMSANQFSSPDNDFVTGLDLDGENNIYMTLQAAVALNIGSQTLNLSNAVSGVLLKFSPNLNFQYFKSFNASFLDIRALDVKDNLLVLGGNYTGNLTSNISGMPTITGTYANRIFGISLNIDGNYISHFEESSSNNLSLNDLSINNIGKIWAIGSFKCTLNSISDDLGEGLFNNIGNNDVFVAYYKSNESNVRTYAQILGGKGDDNANSVFSENLRYPVIAGSFSNTMYMKSVNNCVNCGVMNASNLIYCGISGYGNLNYLQSIGSKDVFCNTSLDTTSNVLDIYARSGQTCELSVIPPKISIDEDTLYLCNTATFNAIHNISNLPFYNENGSFNFRYYNRQWRRNGSLISTANNITVNISGTYILRMSSQDNCRIFYDTIEVIMLQDIVNPQISVTGASLYDVIGSPSGCRLNIPTEYQNEITVNGQTYNSTDSLTWTYTTPDIDEVIATNVPSVNLSEGGNYTYGVQTQSGCSGETCFSIWPYVEISFDGGNLPISPNSGAQYTGIAPIVEFAFTGVVNDTIRVCKNYGQAFETLSPQLVLSLDGGINYFNLSSPSFGYWTISGQGVIFPIIFSTNPPDTIPRYSFFNHFNRFRATQSGWVTIKLNILRPWENTDTTYTVTKNYYIELSEGLEANINFNSSTTDLCPGDTTTISFSVEPVFPFVVTTTNSIGPSGVNSYDFAFPGSVNVFINYTDNYSGCKLNMAQNKTVVYKEAPNINSSPSSARKCPEDSVQIFGQSGQSINWIGPTGDTLGTNFDIYVVPPGNYYYNLIDIDGCSLLSNTIEVRNIQAVIYDSIITSNICGGEAALIRLAPDTNLVYNWLSPLAGSDTIKYISQPGLYAVSVELCSRKDTLNFEVKVGLENVDLHIISQAQFLCQGKTVELAVNPLATSYLWQPDSLVTEQYTVAEPGWVKVTVFDTLGCVLSDSLYFNLFQNPGTPSGISIPNACPGTPVTMSVNTNHLFIWHLMPDSSIIYEGNNYEISVDSSGQLYAGYVVNPNTGCRSTWIENQTTLLSTTNIAEFPDQMLFCPGDTVEFFPAEANGIESGYWTGPNQFLLNSNALFIADIESIEQGEYKYTAISAAGFCTYDTAFVNLIERFLEIPEVAVTDSLCDNQPIEFTTSENNNYAYNWSGPAALSHAGADYTIPDSDPNFSGTFILTSREGNCFRVDTFNVFVSTIPPQNPIISYMENICIGDTLFLFNADSLNTIGSIISWFGPSELQLQGSNIAFIPSFQPDLNQNLGLQYGINMCLSSISAPSVQIQPLPVFTFPTHVDQFCEGEAYPISSPLQAYEYSWSDGSNENSAVFYDNQTIYLTVSTIFGCQFTDSIVVETVNCELDDTPNAFSPNADGYNDVLSFKVSGGVLYKASIFDRWGKLIIELKDQEYDWNGSNYMGQKVDDGTYFYILEVKMINGKTKLINGTINVFR